MTADEQLREVAALVTAGADGRPALGGVPVPGTGPAEEALADALYAGWYLQVAPEPPPSGPLRPVELDVVAALRAAHAGSDRFEPGWRARRVSTHGRAEAFRGERTRVVDRGDYLVPARPGLRAEPGDELALLAREDTVENGFWMTFFGDWERAATEVVTRLYWRVSAPAAPALVHALSGLLLDAEVSAAMKAPVRGEGFARADAVVVYLPPAAFTALADRLAAVAEALDGALRDPPPRLARRLARGVGAAEGRAGAESFGQSRCRLVAAALAAPDGTPAVERIRARLAAAGLDPDRPHLEPGSRERYAW